MIFYFNDYTHKGDCTTHIRGKKELSDLIKYIKEHMTSVGKDSTISILEGIYDCADYLKNDRKNLGSQDWKDESLYYDYLTGCIEDQKIQEYGKGLFYLTKANVLLRKAEFLEVNYSTNPILYEQSLSNFRFAVSKIEKNTGYDNELPDTLLKNPVRLEEEKWRMLAHNGIGKCHRCMGAENFNEYELAKIKFELVRSRCEEIFEYFKTNSGDQRDIDFFRHLYENAVNNMGICLQEQRSYEEARKSFCKTIESSMDENFIHNHKLENPLKSIINHKYIELDDYLNDDEKELYTEDEYYEISNLLQAFVNLGILERKQNHYQEAKSVFKFILSCIQENNVDAQNNLGICLRKQGYHREALAQFKEVLHNKEEDLFAKVNSLKCEILCHNYVDIERKLVDLSDKLGGNPHYYMIKGFYYRKTGRFDDAIQTFSELCKTDPSSIKQPVLSKGSIRLKAYYSIAVCFMSKKEFNRADKMLMNILKADPEDERAILDRGWCLLNLGDYESSIFWSERIVKKNREVVFSDTYVRALNNLGYAYFYMKQYKEAKKYFNQVLREEPLNSEALCYRANCLMKLGNNEKDGTNPGKMKRILYDRAKKYYERSLDIHPFNAWTISGYLKCLLALYQEDSENACVERKKEIHRLLDDWGTYFSVSARSALIEYISQIKEEEREDIYWYMAQILPIKEEEDYATFHMLFQKQDFVGLKNKERGKLLTILYPFYLEIMHIKTALRVVRKTEQDKSYECVHYTSIATLKILLSQKAEQKPLFRLLNSVYMNDSMEGETFFEIIKQNKDNNKEDIDELIKKYYPRFHEQRGKEMEEELLPASDVFFTSLTKAKDDIAMWVQYSQKAKGCTIFFDENFWDIKYSNGAETFTLYSEKEYPIYRILYYDPENRNQSEKDKNHTGGNGEISLKDIRNNLKKLMDYLFKLEEILSDWEKKSNIEYDEYKGAVPEIRHFVANSLDEIRFLFKNSEFASEEEYRIVRCTDKVKIHEDELSVPKLYIEVEKDICIDEVQLGPCVANPNELVQWLYATKKVKKVTKSKRHYR